MIQLLMFLMNLVIYDVTHILFQAVWSLANGSLSGLVFMPVLIHVELRMLISSQWTLP